MASPFDRSPGPPLPPWKLSPIGLSTLLRTRFFLSTLPATGAIAIHACGVLHRDQAILLPATSPRTRHSFAILWRAYRPSSPVLSEGCMIIRPDADRFLAFADPSEESGGSPSWVPACLAAIFFIHRAPVTSLLPLSQAHAMARLVACSTLPYPDLPLTHAAFETTHSLATRIPCAELSFHPDRHFFEHIASWIP